MRCRPPRCTPWGSRPATAGGRPPPSRWWPTGRPSTACSGSSAAPAAAPRAPATAGCWSAAAPLASIGGNVAHAQPNLVAQAIAAAIPLAVLAMLEGLKGDAGEVTRLAAQAADLRPRGRARPARPAPAGHHRPTHRPHRQPGQRGGGTRLPAASAARRARTDRPHARSGRGCRPPMPNRGRTASPGRPAPWPRPPAVAAAAPPASCNASAHRLRSTPVSRPSWQLRDAALGYASRGIPVLPLHYPLPHHGDLQPVTGDRQLPARQWGRAARVGIRAAARLASTPWAAWSPTGSRTPPPTGPGSWPGGPATPRPTSAWPPATASTSWTSTAPPAPKPSGQLAAAHGLAELGAAGPHRRGWLAFLPGPHRPRQRPTRPAWSMWTGGAGAAMWSPHPAATPPATPTSGLAGRDLDTPPGQVPAVLLERLQPRQLQRPTGPVQLPAAADGPGDRYARAALAEELARVAAAPVGPAQPPAVGVDPQPLQPGRHRRPRPARGPPGAPRGRRALWAAGRGAPPDPPHPGLGPPGRPGPSRPPRLPHQPRTHPCLAAAAAGGRRTSNQERG